MMNPFILKELAKTNQRELMKSAELRQRTRPAQSAKIAGPGPIKRFIMTGDTLLKKIIVRQKQKTHSPDERLILNENA